MVAESSEHVRLARDPVEYARSVLLDAPYEDGAGSEPSSESPSVPAVEWDVATHYRGGIPETIAYVVTLDTVNFGSGYFPHLLKRPGMSGYFTIAVSLKERFEGAGPLSPSELRHLDVEQVCRIFGQDLENQVRGELMEHYAHALRDLGSFLDERYGTGHATAAFEQLIEDADGSAERLAELLALMPYFHDVAEYRGREVPFMKRAQITPSDLALALGDGAGEAAWLGFRDLDELTIFADNLVPHVLRLDGVLEYSAALGDRLERGELLPAGCPEEVEIRAVALHAVELMAQGLRDEGVQVAPRDLDVLIWNRGQAGKYRGGSKHRTRTIYY